MPRSRNSTKTNFLYFRCKTHYSRIDNSSIYVNIKIYLTILTSLIFLDICIPVPVSLIFETSLAFMTATASLVLFLVHWQMMKRYITLLKFFCVSSVLPSPHPLRQDVPGRAFLLFAQPDHTGVFLLLATWIYFSAYLLHFARCVSLYGLLITLLLEKCVYIHYNKDQLCKSGFNIDNRLLSTEYCYSACFLLLFFSYSITMLDIFATLIPSSLKSLSILNASSKLLI